MSTADLLPRVEAAYEKAKAVLLDEASEHGHWVGELSSSPLSTATTVVALHEVHARTGDGRLPPLIDAGVEYLLATQNDDGGWGDTVKSFSNISTTALCGAALRLVGQARACHPSETDMPAKDGGRPRPALQNVFERGWDYVQQHGGIEGIRERYGEDRTFSVPILTMCAICGVVDWKEVSQLPFELAACPPTWYRHLRLPVVSYALPALIAIGQVRHAKRPTRIPGLRHLRDRLVGRTLRVLTGLQPSTGGFLEAAPLTGFVVMSLAHAGHADHPVVKKGIDFLIDSVRDDGSVPIDTNLATWVTTLSIQALGPDLPRAMRPHLRQWLLDQQWTERHPFTQADPGGWAWTDLPGGVPDADDTPSVLLALRHLSDDPDHDEELAAAAAAGIRWLLGLQNRDGGWPTFCRGWGKLPFDRSAPDLTAHAIRALEAWLGDWESADGPFCDEIETLLAIGDHDGAQALLDRGVPTELIRQRRCIIGAAARGRRYLSKTRRADGTWLPLWFGNQHEADDENPVYGTARVGLLNGAVDALPDRRSADGGWSGGTSPNCSVEETAVALQALATAAAADDRSRLRSRLVRRLGRNPFTGDDLWISRSLDAPIAGAAEYLCSRVEDDSFAEPAPIGFYFAKLWYFEKLYPVIFTVHALRVVCDHLRERRNDDRTGTQPQGAEP